MSRIERYPYQDANLPLETRVGDLVSRFTLEEKIALMMQYQPEIERLEVKAYKHGTEAAHGVAWLGEATSFPQPIGLSCTWNPDLLQKIGSAIGDEARVFYQRNPTVNGLTLWAPTVDMERDPRWGRTEEAYGEDPQLTGDLTAALVKGIQGDHPFYFKAVATLKHFLGNNNEINRGSCSASIDPRNMKEYYQSAFKPGFVKGGAYSMMTAYNAINGTPAILHEDVLKVVKQEWDMNGFIVSDAGDLIGLVKDHNYCETYKDAVARAIKAGIDSITDDKDISCTAIREALEEDLLTEADLDHALQNTFRVRFRLGEFDPDEQNPYAHISETVLCSPEHQALSLQAARESIVLLKNDNLTLPLDKNKLNKVAVIGPLGDVVYRDWYSGSHPYQISPLRGIKNKMQGKAVTFQSGNDHIRLKSAANGKPIRISETDHQLVAASADENGETFELTDWGWGSYTLQSVTSGKLVTSSDDVHIQASADEAFGWFVKEVFHVLPQQEDRIALSTWNGKLVSAPNEGRDPLVVAEDAEIGLTELFNKDVLVNGLEEAVAAARESEVAIVFVGNNPLINGKEDSDRQDLTLAEYQERLVREVYQANPNTVVVVIGSYPFALNWVDEQIPAVLYLSHAGQELGNAVADVLFGDYSPAGRLSMTWYRSTDQLTDIMDYDIINGNKTYMYFDGEPLYPFGHGLTYASFAYDELEITPKSIDVNGEVSVRVRVKNTGSIAGDEVVQLYVHAEASRVKRPLTQLKGFSRIHLKPGEQKTVAFSLPSSELAFWDVTRDRFCVESGNYSIMISRSSADIKLTGNIALHGETVPPRDLTVWTRAENYDGYSGVFLDESQEGGTCVRPSTENGWVKFGDVKWSQGMHAFEARVSGGSEGGSILIRLGGPDGELASTCVVPPAGERQSLQTASSEIDATVDGFQDVYLCFTGKISLTRFRFT